MQHVFLQQSYQDCWEAYRKSLSSKQFIKWDYVILTASNEAQAESYRMQIKYRQEEYYLPEDTKYVVLSDPCGKRVGSGGATLNVLRFLQQEFNGNESDGNPFKGHRVLVIHSGGDSKRVPQYSACGKIFSSVPRELPDGRTSTLFDEFMISMAGVAGRLKEGMLVLSGDVLLLFNPLQIDFTFYGAAALSIKEPVSIGKDHGVFLSDGKDCVAKFLHKQSEKQLREYGAVNGNGNVDLDTGAVAFDTNLMKSLLNLICTDGKTDDDKFDAFVNEQNPLSFYGDFLYPLAEESTLESYLNEAGEKDITEGLIALRKQIYAAISQYKLRLLSLTPAEFIHFGTTAELLKLVVEDINEYSFLSWSRKVGTNGCANTDIPLKCAIYNSLIKSGAKLGEGSYIENTILGSQVRVGNGSIISGIYIEDSSEEEGNKISIPSHVVMNGLMLIDKRFAVRVFSVTDNPKEKCKKLLSGTILNWIDGDMPLWEVPIYPVCQSEEEAVKAALITYRMMNGIASVEEKEIWQSYERLSMHESFYQADVKAMLLRNRNLAQKIEVQKVINQLINGVECDQAMLNFGEKGMNAYEEKLMAEYAGKADFSTAIRIYYALSRTLMKKGVNHESYEQACFNTIRKAIEESSKEQLGIKRKLHLKKEEVKVSLPVRVNWGGGWSDTPPHCMEQGGTVLNAAIKLGGILPVQVTIRKIKDLQIEVASEDVGAYGTIHTIEEVLDCNNPYDAFSLHKAALIACGIVSRSSSGKETLQDILTNLGGGLFISTQVVGIPKGSGLGTSSILAGACVKAIFEMMGESIPDSGLYDIVLCMEQIMSTGGGWQDQVGGLTPGIKFITSQPGMTQSIEVSRVQISEKTKKELNDRFALIYTGQRRLARNLLRDVVGKYVGNHPATVDALFQMQRIAALMRFELEKGNVNEFAKLFNKHWELSKQLDEGSTNTCIEEIFRTLDDLIDGRFIAGAGGGGFLQVIMKQNVTKEQLRKRLHEVFQDSGVDVWDSELYF